MPKPDSSSPASGAPSQSQDAEASSLFQTRVEKLERVRCGGTDPYPARSEFTANRSASKLIKERYQNLQVGEESPDAMRFCGRMITRRDMGKASFAHLQDSEGQIQIYVRKDAVGETAYAAFTSDYDLGDLIGLEGRPFRTKTGELSLRVEKLALLAKALRPLPEKWHGLKDVETRARQRELDLISNEESLEIFRKRSRIVQSLRAILQEQGFLEVETPMMQSIPGGAVARPFETFHNALKQKFYLRVAPELFLKRLLVGGFEKVFEIGRVFRNEGIDTLHNPEFTILEAYEAYGNMETMIALTELLIARTAQALGEKRFAAPFRRATIADLFEKHVGPEASRCVREQDWEGLAQAVGEAARGSQLHKVFDHVFTEKIAPHLAEPTFVTEFPADFSPLAKRKDGAPAVAERFELYIEGEEIANAYSELNDPLEQRKRLEQYRRSHGAEPGEAEGMGLDEAFLSALEYGMPPAGGLGVGVDRLVMLFTGQKSIRNVLLFPTLKSQD